MELDPRIYNELEKLNKASDDINNLEIELSDARFLFKKLHIESMDQLNIISKKLGSCVEKSRPFYDARMKAKEAQQNCHTAALQYEKSCLELIAAKELVNVAEHTYFNASQIFDPTWQEMLNHATQKINEAEIAKLESEVAHKQASVESQLAEKQVQMQQRDWRRNIHKSKPYFEMKASYNQKLEELKKKIEELEILVKEAKRFYSETLSRLESISEEIHARKKRLNKIKELEAKNPHLVYHPLMSSMQFLNTFASNESLNQSEIINNSDQIDSNTINPNLEIENLDLQKGTDNFYDPLTQNINSLNLIKLDNKCSNTTSTIYDNNYCPNSTLGLSLISINNFKQEDKDKLDYNIQNDNNIIDSLENGLFIDNSDGISEFMQYASSSSDHQNMPVSNFTKSSIIECNSADLNRTNNSNSFPILSTINSQFNNNEYNFISQNNSFYNFINDSKYNSNEIKPTYITTPQLNQLLSNVGVSIKQTDLFKNIFERKKNYLGDLEIPVNLDQKGLSVFELAKSGLDNEVLKRIASLFSVDENNLIKNNKSKIINVLDDNKCGFDKNSFYSLDNDIPIDIGNTSLYSKKNSSDQKLLVNNLNIIDKSVSCVIDQKENNEQILIQNKHEFIDMSDSKLAKVNNFSVQKMLDLKSQHINFKNKNTKSLNTNFLSNNLKDNKKPCINLEETKNYSNDYLSDSKILLENDNLSKISGLKINDPRYSNFNQLLNNKDLNLKKISNNIININQAVKVTQNCNYILNSLEIPNYKQNSISVDLLNENIDKSISHPNNVVHSQEKESSDQVTLISLQQYLLSPSHGSRDTDTDSLISETGSSSSVAITTGLDDDMLESLMLETGNYHKFLEHLNEEESEGFKKMPLPQKLDFLKGIVGLETEDDIES